MMETEPAPMPRAQAGGIQATARLMRLEAGTYCIFHAPGPLPGACGPLSGMRISPPPGESGVRVSTFDADGWIGSQNGAALVRVPPPGGVVLVTTYHAEEAPELPGLQVVRLGNGASAPASRAPVPVRAAVQAEAGSMVAHIQRRGDVKAPLGAWMGRSGSGQWLEGFMISPASGLAASDIEYQAILGQDWYSPWVEGGQYCGSRGMALPLLGLRVRLKAAVAESLACRVEASFTDGTRLGPVEDEPLMATTRAPLEAFRIEIVPRASGEQQPVPSDNAAEDSLLAACAGADAQAPAPGRGRRGRRGRPARLPARQEARPGASGMQAGTPQGEDIVPAEAGEAAATGKGDAKKAAASPVVPWWNRRPERAGAGSPPPVPASGRRGKAARRLRDRADA
ncbi:hypothetical protein [Komagataeibacter rhaeticus]|uniref:hypothetical protein n=1 Tax=Komagataeibacter rhaeticus TaxID=215221 RepID=UPI0039ECDDF4